MDNDTVCGAYDANKILPPFFRDLADKIEKNDVSSTQLQKTGEFFMSWLYDTENVEKDKEDKSSFTQEDFRKFVTLGWYVYTHLMEKN